MAAMIERDVVTLWQILRVLSRNWRILLTSVFVMTLFMAIMMLVLPTRYSAIMVVAPATSLSSFDQQPTIRRPLSNLGGIGISSLLGGGETVSSFTIFLETLHSVQLAGRLEQKHEILRQINPTLWDEDKKAWKKPEGVLFSIKSKLKFLFGLPPWSEPSPFTLAELFEANLSVSEIENTGLFLVKFVHEDPGVALTTLTLIYDEAEEQLRERAKKRAKLESEYLKKSLRSAVMPEHREALAELLLGREQVLLLSNTDSPFAADAIEPPIVDPRPVFPRPAIFFILAIISGLFIGTAIIIFLAFRPSWNAQS